MQAEGSKLQRDLRAYLEAVKGDRFTLARPKLYVLTHSGRRVRAHDKLQVSTDVSDVFFFIAMHESSKNVQACLADMYEPEWYGKDEVDSIVEVRNPFHE